MSKFTVFYSWQSDLPERQTRQFIRTCIDDALASVKETNAVEAIRDEATKGLTGAPNIVTSILEKIDECDLFIADVSLCFSCAGDAQKYSPNPNVMFELGYASKVVGWERIICLSNESFGKEYPFDIEHNRITFFRFDQEEKRAKEEQRRIASIIGDTIIQLQKQPGKAKKGKSYLMVGEYSFEHKEVVSSVRAFEVIQSSFFEQNNKKHQTKIQELVSEIEKLTTKMISDKEEKRKINETTASATEVLSGEEKQALGLHIPDFSGVNILSEAPVAFDGVDYVNEQLSKLGIYPKADFFDLGELKKTIYRFSLNGASLEGTEEEKAKYDKLSELQYYLALLDVRAQYIDLFKGVYFVPMAVQNTSTIYDECVHIVISVKAGIAVRPESIEHMAWNETQGLREMLCAEEDKIGISEELFALPEDGIIHNDKSYSIPNLQQASVSSFFNTSSLDKTEEDCSDELKEYIATPINDEYYEFDIQSLRSKECCWLSRGLLIKPIGGVIELEYRISSRNSEEMTNTFRCQIEGN